ncbi:MAG: MATE family efflux transporter [Spirochaetaceae bacterium]|nr:MATE family efflux transporter [Spirochaetaceae bacterium]
MAFPIALQNLMNSLVNLADTVMIGRLGTVEIAAVGIGNNVFFLYNIVLFGICSGGAIFTAQFWGKGDIPGIRRNTGFCLLLAIILGLMFTAAVFFIPEEIMGIYSRDPAVIKAGGVYLHTLALSFIPFAIGQVFFLSLRSIEKLKLPMYCTFVALGINVGLNYLLIFGIGPFPTMGVEGAALGTVCARLTEAVLLVAISYGRKYALAGTVWEMTGFNRFYVGRFLRVCLPVILNEIIWSTGITTQNIIFARSGTEAIAAFNITNTFSQLTWALFIGLGNGVAILIGKKIGAGDQAGARDYAARIIRFAPMIACGAVLVLVPLSRFLPVIFNVNDTVLSAAGVMLVILSISYPFRAFNMSMVVGICRAGGDTVFCTIYDTVFMWFLALPLAAAASYFFHAPSPLIYLCLNSEESCKCFLGLWRYRSGKWLHNVIEGI